MSNQAEQFSHFIGEIYDAAIDASQWSAVLGKVGGVPEVAAALGVAETTVKTHLGNVFGKTGACRQADLVKIAAGFSTPFAAGP
jgi:ATP/maltotriose-dependent transcriptional regulator MalT